MDEVTIVSGGHAVRTVIAASIGLLMLVAPAAAQHPAQPERGDFALAFAVGYKVNSERAVQFRKWATRVVEEVTVGNFRSHPLFPRVQRAVVSILANGKVVTPIDVLIRMESLKPEDVENWRFGWHQASHDLDAPRL